MELAEAATIGGVSWFVIVTFPGLTHFYDHLPWYVLQLQYCKLVCGCDISLL